MMAPGGLMKPKCVASFTVRRYSIKKFFMNMTLKTRFLMKWTETNKFFRTLVEISLFLDISILVFWQNNEVTDFKVNTIIT